MVAFGALGRIKVQFASTYTKNQSGSESRGRGKRTRKTPRPRIWEIWMLELGFIEACCIR